MRSAVAGLIVAGENVPRVLDLLEFAGMSTRERVRVMLEWFGRRQTIALPINSVVGCLIATILLMILSESNAAVQRIAIEAERQRFTLRQTRRTVPITFSIMLVQASERRSSFGNPSRVTVRCRPSSPLPDRDRRRVRSFD